jgi:hypothetical protein
MLTVLQLAALGAAAVLPMLIPPEAHQPEPQTATVAVAAQHVEVEIEAFDSTGKRIPFTGTVTIATGSTTCPVRVDSGRARSMLSVPLGSCGGAVVAAAPR